MNTRNIMRIITTRSVMTALGIPVALATVAGAIYFMWSRHKSSSAAKDARSADQPERRRPQKNIVDVASADSFPASDPPAFSANRYN
ncbi:MAG: hypothetical protein H6714_05675 [Myxococcales bacterium]|nr:hypothetical protein [Myxococcales bacterium]